MSSTKTAALYSRLKGDGVFAKEKEELQDVNVRLDALVLRDNIAGLLQVLLRQRTRGAGSKSSLLTEENGTSACSVALANRVVAVLATSLHVRASGAKCEDGCCEPVFPLPRLLAELCLSIGPVTAATVGGITRRFVPVLGLGVGDCGIPSGWDKDREEAAMDALKAGKPALPMVDVTAEAVLATPVSSWWLMERHGQEIYSPFAPASALAPIDFIGPLLMLQPFADSVALYVDGPGQVHKGLRKNMDAVSVPATCPEFLAASAGVVVSVKIAQKVAVERQLDGSIVVAPVTPVPEVRKSQSGGPPPAPPTQPAAGSRDASSAFFPSCPSLRLSPAAAAIACGEQPEPSGSSAGPPSARPSLTGNNGPWAPRASVSSNAAIARVSSAKFAPYRAPSFTGSASGAAGAGATVTAVPKGDFGTKVPRAPGGPRDAVPPPSVCVDDQTWLVFVRHYMYRAVLTNEATRELTWETFIQGCY